jgi:hypothetical protein
VPHPGRRTGYRPARQPKCHFWSDAPPLGLVVIAGLRDDSRPAAVMHLTIERSEPSECGVQSFQRPRDRRSRSESVCRWPFVGHVDALVEDERTDTDRERAGQYDGQPRCGDLLGRCPLRAFITHRSTAPVGDTTHKT